VNDKQILITGATNGIGLAAAEALAARGTNLAIVGRSNQDAYCVGSHQDVASNRQAYSKACNGIPYATEQGISERVSGKIFQGTGNFHPKCFDFEF
jgi:NAD(P)-dependent dehydrogenase (short-subunit alcohol dehydrogenase family)